MLTATKNLENDHVYILLLTDIMVSVTKQDAPDITHIEEIVDLIRNFADGIHHIKEENYLFPALNQKGMPSEGGPVAVMLHEHELGRNYVGGMIENINRYKAGEVAVLAKIHENMLAYAGLLKNHIYKENNILFRMADGMLSEDEQQQMLSEFSKLENPEQGDKHASYVERINNLAAIYL